MTRMMTCPACADERPFEQPGCGDHHGVDCPEWFCMACGGAVLVGLTPVRVHRTATVAA